MSTTDFGTGPTNPDVITKGKMSYPKSFEGRTLSTIGNHLVVTDMTGKRCFLSLAKDVKLTCDGAGCNLKELKAGRRVWVTIDHDSLNMATGIDLLVKNADFSARRTSTTA